ncbi:MAG: DUF5050 domain-containing protein [Anaerostipes sp.]|nr:DUF5050 domain-containing protein [Anaerostipes sp.]
MNPLNTTGNNLTIQGENIYYNMFGAEEGIQIFQKKNGSLKEKMIAEDVGEYVVSEKEMYYTMDDEAIEDKGHYDKNPLYKLDLTSGKKKIILQGSMSNVLREDHGNLYCYDIQKKLAIEMSLQKGEIVYCENLQEVS